MRILNIGCGPVKHGGYPGISLVCADSRAHEGAEIANMEQLPYANDSFDVVVCINALDHTRQADLAVTEMVRVAKSMVYIDCALIQKTTSGKNHYWDMLENGIMTNGTYAFDMRIYGFEIEFVDNKMERRYNHVIARLTK